MFQALEAAFERRDILKAQTLNELLNAGLNYTEQAYSTYGDGILQDFVIESQDGFICVKKGLIKFQGKIYCNDSELKLRLVPNNAMEYLKVAFHEVSREGGVKKWSTDLMLNEKTPERNNEIELCRFQYQEGAKLRNDYSSFKDCASSYNVVNRLHATYAAPGGDGLAPVITMKFAEEMQKGDLKDPIDFAFMMECARGNVLNRNIIITYLRTRFGVVLEHATNQELFREMEKILDGQAKPKTTKSREQRMIII